MIRTIIHCIFITGFLAKNYLIEVGDKREKNGSDQGVGEETGEDDYSVPLNIEMKEYGQFNIWIYFVFNLMFKTCQSFKEEAE